MITQIINLAALAWFTITDIKKQEIPDNQTIPFILLNTLIPLILVIGKSQNEIVNTIALTIFGLISGWLLCWLFYLLNQWGGADGKIMIALSIASIKHISTLYASLAILSITYIAILKITKQKLPAPLMPAITLAYMISINPWL